MNSELEAKNCCSTWVFKRQAESLSADFYKNPELAR